MNSTLAHTLHIYDWGTADYVTVWQAMKTFTDSRNPETADALWLVEHPPVFTQGQAGKPEHILHPNHIPLIQTDRGGQITYHGPGQLVAYPLIDLKRKDFTVRSLVHGLEEVIIKMMQLKHILHIRLLEVVGGEDVMYQL